MSFLTLLFCNLHFRWLPKIFDRYSSADGFLFVEDDTILNYWNLLQADKTKLWTTDKVLIKLLVVRHKRNVTNWFLKNVRFGFDF